MLTMQLPQFSKDIFKGQSSDIYLHDKSHC